MADTPRPTISAVSWVPARDVLPHEAADFTPWLADNLDLLAEALGIEELTLVETESKVAEKRLDILANAVDDDGSEYPVIIENQYGITDHRHLGQLVTYLAQQGRGLAVWVVEASAEAHIAAVDFLNRTSSNDVGYVLTRVRFTHGTDGGYQVAFEMLARPNTFLRDPGARGSKKGAGKVNPDKRAFLTAILEQVRQPLSAVGLRHMHTHSHGAYIEMRFPADCELDGWETRLKIKTTRTACNIGVHVAGFDTREENAAAIDLLRDRYEAKLTPLLPAGAVFTWHAGAPHAASDYVRIALAGQGYVGGTVDAAAAFAQTVCTAWANVLASDPLVGFEAAVQEAVVRQDEPSVDVD